jgi:TolB-like protein/class 3 adenylate cyclase/tetratricopeptide (TPR) repeat protein
MGQERTQRRLAAILAADVVGYSRLIGADEEGTLAALKAVRRELIDPKVDQHHGRIVKTTGDGALIEFASVVDAVRCAVDVQRGTAERNTGMPPDKRIEFRIGINVGDVVIDGDDILGDGVNIAARLEGLAEPGGVLVSRAVRDQVRDRLELAFEDLGERELKNIARLVRVYRVRGPTELTATPVRGEALPLPDKPSIAVLPFTNMSGDAEHEYFADGIAEDIITGLSRLRWLFVIARNSSFTYKHRHVDVRQVGRELGVRYILEGSVRKSGNRVRITGQLIEAETGNHLWAERYDRASDDVFMIQDEITESVIGCIHPELYAAEHGRLKRKPPQSLDAWESFVRGLFLYSEHSNKGTREALDMLARAIELDNNYSQAHGLRAVCLGWRAYQGWEDRETTFAKVAEAANRSVACDPQEPWGHLAQGFVAMAKRSNADAVGAFTRAINASPNFAYAHGLLGTAHSAGGRPEQAIECIDRGVRLSPRDIFGDEYHLYYAFAHFQAGRYAEAASAALLGIQQRPDHPTLYAMAAASYGLGGETDKAKALVAQLTGLVPNALASDFEEFFYCRQEDRSRLARGLRSGGLPG